MDDDKKVLTSLDGKFDKTKVMLGRTLGKLDDLVSKGSTSICCYVVLFVIMILAILFKLG